MLQASLKVGLFHRALRVVKSPSRSGTINTTSISTECLRLCWLPILFVESGQGERHDKSYWR